MKKKIMMLSCIAACAIVSGYVGMKAYESHAYESNSLLIQNVEALTSDIERPCDNSSGFRMWATSGFLKTKKEFYDCCYKIQQGYSPSGNCRQ
ncbi:MAG: hypothetical protein ACI3ZJ_07920 [Bacteroidaceae bacterium]|nr:hypothetical protein [Bacteroidales bacterium]